MAEPNQSPRILVVDDTSDIRELTGKYLTRNGYRCALASSAAEARKTLGTETVDLVLLDIMMPGEDGLSLCRHIRETRNIPVILVTALGEDTDRIIGLEVGADDYVAKPFNPRELLARVKAVLRRTNALPPDTQPQHSEGTIRFGDWTFDPVRRELTGADGIALSLSSGEYKMLQVFLAHPGAVLSRDRLLDLTQGRDAAPFDRAIDNQVSRLRRKIEEDPKNPTLIKTVWGGGYVFSAKLENPA